jgi:hypothetical protein
MRSNQYFFLSVEVVANFFTAKRQRAQREVFQVALFLFERFSNKVQDIILSVNIFDNSKNHGLS